MTRGPRMMTRDDVARELRLRAELIDAQARKRARLLEQERAFLARRAARRDRLRSILAWLKRGGS